MSLSTTMPYIGKKKTDAYYYNFCSAMKSLDSAVGQEKEIKYIRIRKEERKLSIFTDMILYVEKSKESTNKLLELKMVSQGCHL